MQIKIITLSPFASKEEQEELNHFLRANKIIEVRKEVVKVADDMLWSFCITYMPDARHGGEVVRSQSCKYIRYERNLADGTWNEALYEEHILPLFAFAMHASCKAFRRTIVQDVV